jgi:hypothetical protein
MRNLVPPIPLCGHCIQAARSGGPGADLLEELRTKQRAIEDGMYERARSEAQSEYWFQIGCAIVMGLVVAGALKLVGVL